ncbi:glycosyltransferase [Paenibacillus sp. P13VS]|uniref:glycosyltransferase n=1 Tax=Paenibacillus sp. P13VS TaxID=2697367 RepID=UPI00187B94A7|nr:glycosyltransferase [Paenibacillus sp. P13VS]MBE7681559.1 glycosyltransferase [Paenibacillus sp. P13VS]
MNIAIDVLAILSPDSKNRGIGNYNASQFKRIFETDKENKYFLLNFYEDVSLKSILNYSENVQEFYFYPGPDNLLLKKPAYKGIIGNIVKNFIKEHNIEVFYITSPFDSNMSYEPEWLHNVQVIATVYDIIPYLFKERYLKDKYFYNQYMNWIDKIKQADRILAISQSVKNDLVKYIHIQENKIEVIYAGTDEWYKEVDLSDEDVSEIRNRYRIHDEFIMCTGGDDDRKNIAELIKAYSKMPKQLIDKYQLVVACKLSDASEERYYNIAKKHGVNGRVILTNFVPLDHLIKLYNMAYIMAFPSQYEGFGLPVVEAMACGTPILTSNNSSLGEIAQGAAVLVDPFEINDITRGLIEILEQTDLNDLRIQGLNRVKKFSWDIVAERTIEAINRLEIINNEKFEKIEKKKIAFFTPLPPLQSGIADYSVDILNELSKYLDIDVYIDSGYKIDCEFEGNVEVFSHDKYKNNKDKYLDTVYQMGNSEFHTYMIDYIQRYRGTLVLHDNNLHGLIYHLSVGKNNYQLYKKYLYEDFEKELIDNYVEKLTAGKESVQLYKMIINGVVTNYANKIIVHSDYAKKKLLQKSLTRQVEKIFLYAKTDDLENQKLARGILNIPTNKQIISAFGHIHETKRIIPILRAFEKLCSNDNNNLLLYLVGKPAESIENEMNIFINNNNLRDKVIITGYTDMVSFEQYIDATDICLNLRHPYNGETSASLMRILAKRKCVIVTDIGSFSEVPDSCCIKIPSPENLSMETEVNLIYQELLKLTNDRQLIEEFANNARNYAEMNLDISIIANQYKEFILLDEKKELSDELLTSVAQSVEKEIDLYNLAYTLSYSI